MLNTSRALCFIHVTSSSTLSVKGKFFFSSLCICWGGVNDYVTSWYFYYTFVFAGCHFQMYQWMWTLNKSNTVNTSISNVPWKSYTFVGSSINTCRNISLTIMKIRFLQQKTTTTNILETQEPRHDKTNSVRPAKTQISLGIRCPREESLGP